MRVAESDGCEGRSKASPKWNDRAVINAAGARSREVRCTNTSKQKKGSKQQVIAVRCPVLSRVREGEGRQAEER